MSMIDETSCFNFKEDKDFSLSFKDKIAYVPLKRNKFIFIYKIRINKVDLCFDCYSKNKKPNRYIHFSVQVQSLLDKIRKTFKWYSVNNFYYSGILYSEFSPFGFINEEIIFKTEKEAIEYAQNNNIPDYFIYDVFKDKKILIYSKVKI